MSPDISEPLAARYAEFVDLLKSVDVAALDSQIARLISLREAVAKLNGVPEQAQAAGPVPQPIPVIHQRPRGFWVEACKAQLAAGPKTVNEIVAAVADGASKGSYVSVLGCLKNNSHLFRRLSGRSPFKYALVYTAEPDEPAKEIA